MTVIVAQTFDFLNNSCEAAASGTRPIVDGEITHSTGSPSGYFNVLEIRFATLLAMFIVCTSSDSRTP